MFVLNVSQNCFYNFMYFGDFRKNNIMVHDVLGFWNELHASNESQYSDSVHGSSYAER